MSGRKAGEPSADSRQPSAVSRQPLALTVNGREVSVDRPPLTRLLDVLREDLHLTGTKEGCGEGECGACTVLLDGAPVCSCLVPLAQARGREVRTIESLDGNHPLQTAFVEAGGAQCGACTPGMIMAALALPPDPTREQVRTGLAGNLCRCTGYEAIYRAVAKATAPPAVSRQPSAVSKEPSAVSRQPSDNSRQPSAGGEEPKA